MKSNKRSNKFVSILSLIVVIAFLAVGFLGGAIVTVYLGPTDSIYYSEEQGESYILQFVNDYELALYHYRVENSWVYGIKTLYSYSAEEYNHIIGPLHIYPSNSLFFWTNIAFYDHTSYVRARATLSVENNATLRLGEGAQLPRGSYRVEIVDDGDTLTIDGMTYNRISPDKENEFRQIMDEFDLAVQE